MIKNILYSMTAVAMLGAMYGCHATKQIVRNEAGVEVKRVKLSLVEGYTEEGDKFTANDQFVTVVYKGNVILCTSIKDDANKTAWPNEYVVFDYAVNDTVVISQLDDDYTYHDLLSQYVGRLKVGVGTANRQTSHLTFLVQEVTEDVKTTGTTLPGNGNSDILYKDIRAKGVIKDKSSLKFDKK
jgi:hypothetical protein